MKSDELKAEEVVSICDAGRNRNIVNASGRDLFDIEVVNVPRLVKNKSTAIPKRPQPIRLYDYVLVRAIRGSQGVLQLTRRDETSLLNLEPAIPRTS